MASPAPDKASVDQARALVEATTFDIFNEHDQPKRRLLMDKYWASNLTCYSPFGVATGYDALDKVWDSISELDEHYFDDDGQCIACRRAIEYRRRSKRIAAGDQKEHAISNRN